jgi:hypothetical protein
MSFFLRYADIIKEWREELHPRGKTSPESRGGSFKPAHASGAGSDDIYAGRTPAGYVDNRKRSGKSPNKTQAEISANALKVGEEVSQAYADARPGGQTPTEEAYAQRNLNFIASSALSALEAVHVLPKAIGQYNEFNPKKVTNKILEVAPDVKIWMGRSGSPAMFITGPVEQLQHLQKLKALKADEVNLHDAGYRVKDYEKPRKPDPVRPDSWEDLKVFDEPVLRLWWD